MNLDLQDFSVHNAESRDLRAFQLGKTNDQMGDLGIVCPLDVRTGQVRWTMRMGMVDRDELFPGIGQISQNLDQFCRIHFELGRALGDIWHRYESPSLSRWRAGRGPRASNQTTRLFRICRLRMLDDLLQYSRCERKVHGKILPGFRILFGSIAALIVFIASISAGSSAIGRNSDFMIPIPCSPDIVPPISIASAKILRFVSSAFVFSAELAASIIKFTWMFPSPTWPKHTIGKPDSAWRFSIAWR